MARKKFDAPQDLDERLAEAFSILQVYDDSRLEALVGEEDLCEACREGAAIKCSRFYNVGVTTAEVKDLAAKILDVRKEDAKQSEAEGE